MVIPFGPLPAAMTKRRRDLFAGTPDLFCLVQVPIACAALVWRRE
jgi:hypothetical protein